MICCVWQELVQVRFPSLIPTCQKQSIQYSIPDPKGTRPEGGIQGCRKCQSDGGCSAYDDSAGESVEKCLEIHGEESETFIEFGEFVLEVTCFSSEITGQDLTLESRRIIPFLQKASFRERVSGYRDRAYDSKADHSETRRKIWASGEPGKERPSTLP